MGDSITHKHARSLRRPMSPPEARLWTRLRGHRLHGFKFRRQHPIGYFILDFYCAAARLAVEVDGARHDDPLQIEHDRRRTMWLNSQGIRVIRIAARNVRDELEGVLAFIAWVVRQRIGETGDAPSTAVPAVPLPIADGEVSAPRP